MPLPNQVSLGFVSPVGRLRVTATANHVVEIKLRAPEVPDGSTTSPAAALCRQARDEILAYLAGEVRDFEMPWRLHTEGWKHRVLMAMAAVPYARTVTYGELARRSGEGPGASRAVGAICGANPLPLVVPCHRVVAADGLGGFGGGLPMKRWLLRLETTGRAPAPLSLDGSDPDPRTPGDDPLAHGVQQNLFDA